MERLDEVIIPVLAPEDLACALSRRGLRAVRADLDPETMSITASTVLDQVTTDTRSVFVTPFRGIVGPWETLRGVTEPRGISLEVEGKGGAGKWEKLAPGLRGMAEDLIEVDAQLIAGGAAGFAEELLAVGVPFESLPGWPGKRRDYPGMTRIESQVLVVENWQQWREELVECARRTARQQQLPFEDLRRQPTSAGLDEARRRRAG